MRRDVAGRIRPLGKRHRFGQRLFATAEVGEVERGEAGDAEHNLADSAPLAELDALAADSQRRLRSLVMPGSLREVAVNRAGVTTLATLDREREHPAHVVQALPTAEVGARRSTEAESARRLGQAE